MFLKSQGRHPNIIGMPEKKIIQKVDKARISQLTAI
jgi:hypothetical protein